MAMYGNVYGDVYTIDEDRHVFIPQMRLIKLGRVLLTKLV